MSNELIIPEEIPAYLTVADVDAARVANEEALDGLMPPMPPSIGISGTRFVLKKSDGTEESIKTTEIQVIVLRAKRELDKSYYATKYDPNKDEGNAPDCYSIDGVKPDPSSPLKQSESCAGCPQNVFGSGTGADGTPSKGKACSDNKILAAFYKGEVYRFKIPPASLKAFAEYVRAVSSRGITLGNVVTTIGFNEKFTYAVLTFGFAGFVPEQHLGKLADLSEAQEVQDIIKAKPVLAPAPAQPAPAQVEEPATVDAADLGLEEEPAETAEEKAAREKKEKAAAKRKAAAKAKKEKEAAAKAEAEKKPDLTVAAEPEKAEEAAAPAETATDDELALELGL